MTKIVCVCGARPNFMKIAPIMCALKSYGGFETLLVHTGQHYDEIMSNLFISEFVFPNPISIWRWDRAAMPYRPPRS